MFPLSGTIRKTNKTKQKKPKALILGKSKFPYVCLHVINRYIHARTFSPSALNRAKNKAKI